MNILEFCNQYKAKLKNDLEIEVNPSLEYYMDYRERITFVVSHIIRAPGYMPTVHPCPYPSTLILDDEDLKYLYDKYSVKLTEELNQKIESLKLEYASK